MTTEQITKTQYIDFLKENMTPEEVSSLQKHNQIPPTAIVRADQNFNFNHFTYFENSPQVYFGFMDLVKLSLKYHLVNH